MNDALSPQETARLKAESKAVYAKVKTPPGIEQIKDFAIEKDKANEICRQKESEIETRIERGGNCMTGIILKNNKAVFGFNESKNDGEVQMSHYQLNGQKILSGQEMFYDEKGHLLNQESYTQSEAKALTEEITHSDLDDLENDVPAKSRESKPFIRAAPNNELCL